MSYGQGSLTRRGGSGVGHPSTISSSYKGVREGLRMKTEKVPEGLVR